MVLSVNDNEHDAEVQFMHPHGPATSIFGLLGKTFATFHTPTSG